MGEIQYDELSPELQKSLNDSKSNVEDLIRDITLFGEESVGYINENIGAEIINKYPTIQFHKIALETLKNNPKIISKIFDAEEKLSDTILNKIRVDTGHSFENYDDILAKDILHDILKYFNGILSTEERVNKAIEANKNNIPHLVKTSKLTSTNMLMTKILQTPEYINSLLNKLVEYNTTSLILTNPKNIGSQYFGSVLGANGKVYFIPSSVNRITEYDPLTGNMLTFAENITKCNGGCLGSDNKIYMCSGKDMHILDTNTLTVETINLSKHNSVNISTLVSANNGKIYGLPSSSKHIVEFDIITKTHKLLGYFDDRNEKTRGAVVSNSGKIYSIPGNIPEVIEFDPNTHEVYMFKIEMGQSEIDKGHYYYNGCLASNGKIYCSPRKCNRILEIDPVTRTAKQVGPIIEVDSLGYTGITMGINGLLYMIRHNKSTIVEFNPDTYEIRKITTLSNSADDFIGATLLHNGSILFSNFSSQTSVILHPSINSKNDVVATEKILTLVDKEVDSVREQSSILYKGKIYSFPYWGTSIQIIDPIKKTSKKITMTGNTRFSGVCLGSNNKIYASPTNSDKTIEFDPSNDTFKNIYLKGNYTYSSCVARGKYIYFIPNSSQAYFTILDTSNNSIKEIPIPAYVAGDIYAGVLSTLNNKIYCAPCNGNKIYVINENDTVSTISGLNNTSGNYKYKTIIEGPDKNIYCIPSQSSSILEIDVKSDTIIEHDTIKGGYKWFGATIGTNGKIYACPDSSDKILEFDPVTKAQKLFNSNVSQSCGIHNTEIGLVTIPMHHNDVHVVKNTDIKNGIKRHIGTRRTASWKYSGGIVDGDKLYLCPYNSKKLSIIDLKTNVLEEKSTTINSNYSYIDMVKALDGKFYCIPRYGRVAVIDPITDTVSYIGDTFTGDYLWSSGVLSPNGKIFATPDRDSSILVIDPISKTTRKINPFNNHESGMFSYSILGPNNKIYFLPMNNNEIMEFNPDTELITSVYKFDEKYSKIRSAIFIGNILYCLPKEDLWRVIKFNIITHEVKIISIATPKNSTSIGEASVDSDGIIYCPPYYGNDTLLFNTNDDTYQYLEGYGDEPKEALYRSSVCTEDDRVLFIPCSAKYMEEVSHKVELEAPHNLVTSVHINKL